MSLRVALAALALGGASSPSVATMPAPDTEAGHVKWRSVDADTGAIRDVAGLEQLARDFPDSGNVRLRALQPLIEAGEYEKVLATLEWLYERGYVFGATAQEQIPRLMQGVDPGRIAERLRAESEVIASSEIIGTVPAEAGLVESVAVAGSAGYMAATSVTGKSVYLSDPNGTWVAIDPANASDLSGIVSDRSRNIGWVASGNIDNSDDPEQKFSGVIGLPGGQDALIYIAAPEGVHPSDLHLAANNTLYTSDPIGGGVYHAASDMQVLDELVALGTFRSPQGLATSEDGSKLYVSDYRYGIAIVDLATRKVTRLAAEIPVLLDGVDGMWRHGNELIVVQNGTSPMRIAAFELSSDGLRVVGHRVLEQAHPEWTEPLGGSLDGNALVYVGNGQWDRFVKGEPAQDKPALPTQIRRLPLD